MSKTLHDRPILFRRLRILQLMTVSFIVFLEIIQTITFIGLFKDIQPISFYFSSKTFNLCGIKLLYHIVITITLLSTLYYFIRFSHRWYHGPYQTDIYLDLILFYLWIVAGITNIFPLLKGEKWVCLDSAFGFEVEFLMRILCDGYIFSTVSGWIMILEFFASTILYLKLWRTRDWWDNNDTKSGDNDSEKGINLERDEEIPLENTSPTESVNANSTQETLISNRLAIKSKIQFS